ncbi:hypothetical protein IWW36_003472 [Coemansia brasiliensis]|uniref:Uncharacterized protein n=1 Tax=Coemansia brasiliensis TaxID=2650707 RepID=A0A9W8IA47_9FUNG|nr:hypothetical protein IWW36_003472 [Coemansia brasiliensis]
MANDRNNVEVHARTYSNSSNLTHEQSPPHSPHPRSYTAGPGHPIDMHRSGMVGDSSPSMIRQTRTELPQTTRKSNHGSRGSSVHSCGSGKGVKQTSGQSASGQGHNDESSRVNYALWRSWEESLLVNWLYEPENRKLFNIPRRKKECHERIIREVLPEKTSRAIEGKIRTLEKRYQKTVLELQEEDFAEKHPGKEPEEVCEELCPRFSKLEAIFNPSQAHARSHLASLKAQHLKQHGLSDKRKASWSGTGGAMQVVDKANGAVPAEHGLNSAASVNASAISSAGTSNSISAPRNSPPRIEAAESMPVGSSSTVQGRRIAPKRGSDGDEVHEGDGPVMMSSNKRSRTMPSIMQNRLSPGHQYPHHYHHHHHPQRSPLPLQQATMQLQQYQQQQQQQRMYENGSSRLVFDTVGRPSTATLPMMQLSMQSPVVATNGPMAVSNVHQHQHVPPRHHPTQASTAPPNMQEAAETASSGVIQGTREELEWLQFNLRREELDFRKVVFAHDQSLENKRIQLEEYRIENQRREMELESKRLDVHKQQLDIQIESLKSLTSMLGQMVSQMSTAMNASKEPSNTESNESVQQK